MSSINSVFYADSYHPIQAGSIDGTDIAPHDNAIYRAHLCSSFGLYDPHGDPKVIGDPYCTLFVGHLSHFTTEDTLQQAMSKYGRVKNLRLVRHIVTGASRGYAFVEFETEKEMRRAYQDAHHSFLDDSEIIVDYNRQQLMQGWIPRRLGGGLGGKKESGQLRFGGRERPFRAPLRPIPFDELKKLGIPPPPVGRYLSRSQVPSPPRREKHSVSQEICSHGSSKDQGDYIHRRSSIEEKAGMEEEYHYRQSSNRKSSVEKDDKYSSYETREDHRQKNLRDRDHRSHQRRSTDEDRDPKRSKRHSRDRKDRSHDEHKSKKQRNEERQSFSRDNGSDY
ncbi:hypothetical protein SAY86_019218 [Trapa natans]|uniref:RRM domain-containing protein n=1 Tax=Trapa natans TaxID=22666 RepID=A0AAN7R1N4_TRANT|nr:hypothetical protein SAY86_019218 [Trapa natans]